MLLLGASSGLFASPIEKKTKVIAFAEATKKASFLGDALSWGPAYYFRCACDRILLFYGISCRRGYPKERRPRHCAVCKMSSSVSKSR